MTAISYVDRRPQVLSAALYYLVGLRRLRMLVHLHYLPICLDLGLVPHLQNRSLVGGRRM